MPTIELSAGTIDYLDTGGDGPTVVLVHGVVMDPSVWRDVTEDLRADHRVVAPTLPLGGHRRPMRADADLSMVGQADLVAELIERLDLSDVTLVANDWGGPIATAVRHPDLVDRLVLTPCEAFDNIPPGLPGAMLVALARLPGGLLLTAQLVRLSFFRRLPTTFGPMAVDPVPADLVAGWFAGLRRSRGVRRDLRRYVRTTDMAGFGELTAGLGGFEAPALVIWTPDGRMMPADHGRRLAELLPHGHHAELPDARVLVQLDRPAAVAGLVRDFVSAHPLGAAVGDAPAHSTGAPAP